jgi:hypothetical protein
MMLQAVIWAKENQKKYIYLGTCYEKTALYKTEFKGVEYFNGFHWNNNLEELKDLLNYKNKEYFFKRKDFLQKYYQNNLEEVLKNYGTQINF